VVARRWQDAWIGPFSAVLGVFLVGTEAMWIGWLAAVGRWTPALGLPLHLCDAAALVAAAAVWTRRRALVELLWFWAAAGTTQALVTPAPYDHFPGLMYFQYYGGHGAIVVATLFLVVGLRLTPARGAAVRSFLLTAGYAAVVGAVDVVTGGDYMFLRYPPPGVHTLFDVMGPWPRYLVVSALLGVVLFALLELPFRLRRASAPASERAGGLLAEPARGGVPPGGTGR
jgi:hypothetical integral membrane protein (TIGR02206 family)